MEKLAILFLMLYLVAMAIGIAPLKVDGADIPKDPESVEKWFRRTLPNSKEKLTKLHFFFYDIAGGKNPSAVTVAQANGTFQSPAAFGLLRVMDDALRVTADPESNIIGRAQGIYAAASLEEFGLLMTLNFVFTDGEYNGSTLSVVGYNPTLQKYREMAVVGGSGVFRMARGIATARTVWFNLTTFTFVIEYHVLVLHY